MNTYREVEWTRLGQVTLGVNIRKTEIQMYKLNLFSVRFCFTLFSIAYEQKIAYF